MLVHTIGIHLCAKAMTSNVYLVSFNIKNNP